MVRVKSLMAAAFGLIVTATSRGQFRRRPFSRLRRHLQQLVWNFCRHRRPGVGLAVVSDDRSDQLDQPAEPDLLEPERDLAER